MVFFDRIFNGSDEMYAKAEQEVNAVVAELGPDADMKLPDTAYYLACCYSFLGRKITTLGELQAVLPEIKSRLLHEQNTDSVFSSGIATAIAAEVIEACKYARTPTPYEGTPYHGHFSDAEVRELGVPLVTRDIPGFVVMIGPAPSDEEAVGFQSVLEEMRFIRSTEYVSREQGTEEMAELLGEDFLDVFESTPIPVSVDVTLDADYVSRDSLEVVREEIAASPLVDEVVYQTSLVEALNANLSKISSVLAIFIALMLFISFVLINNTVRLSVFDKRFTIHTMKMVGATRGFIRAPFMLQSLFQGLFSAIIAILMLLAILFFIRNGFAQLFEIFRLDLLLVVMGIVTASGIIICMGSTWLTVNKLVSLNKDELYF